MLIPGQMHKHASDTGIVLLPKIAPHLRVNAIHLSPDHTLKSLLITSAQDKNFSRVYPANELCEWVLEAVDGNTHTADLIQKISSTSPYPPNEVSSLLSTLCDADVVISGSYAMSDGQAALWLNRGFTPALVEDVCSGQSIALVNHALDPAYQNALTETLNAAGINIVGENAGCENTSDEHGVGEHGVGEHGGGDSARNLTLVIVDDYLQESLRQLNRDYLHNKTPWLPIKLAGNAHWAGPIFNSKAGNSEAGNAKINVDTHEQPHMATDFCWQCLSDRITNCRPLEQGLYRQTGILPTPAPAMEAVALQASAYRITQNIIEYWLTAEPHAEQRAHQFCASVWVWDHAAADVGGLATDWYTVNKNPLCAVCESESESIGAGHEESGRAAGISPYVLDDDKTGTRYVSSGWRVIPPEQTYENYRHLNNPHTGVVDSLYELKNPVDDDCFIAESANNIATRTDTVFMSLMSIMMRNAGKGTTAALARTGALCESIERYSTSFHGSEVCKRVRYCDFPSGEALMPNSYMNYSERQFELAENPLGNPFVNVPSRLAEDEHCEWSPIWSLTENRAVWVPSQSLYFGYPYGGHWIASPDTNGVAAGNTPTEAFVQGFLEVLERDAISLWWYNRLQCAELALDSVDVPFVRRVVAQYERRDRQCWVLDISLDLGVAVFVFLSRKKDSAAGGEEICFGCAAHFDAEIALTRAVCEHSQLWTMIENRREKTFFKELSPAFSNWLKNASTDSPELNYLLPASQKSWRDYPQKRDFNLLDQRRACLAMVIDQEWQL